MFAWIEEVGCVLLPTVKVGDVLVVAGVEEF